MKNVTAVVLLGISATVCHGQMANSYNAAAQLWFTQAAACQNPVAAACMRANGRYNQCLAAQLTPGGPSSCTQPTCSSSCPASGGTAGTTAGAANNNNVNNIVQLGAGLISLFHKDNPQPDPQPETDTGPTPEELAAEDAAAEAARQQQINSDAASILQQANSLAAANNPPTAAPSPSPSDSTSAVSALLADSAPAPSASSAVASLLGDSPVPNVSTTNTVVDLLANSTVSDSASIFPPTFQPANIDPQFAAASTYIQDPPVDASQVPALDNDLLGDNSIDVNASAMWQGMKNTANNALNAAGDLLNSHPLQTLAQSLGLTPNPNADSIDIAVHNCGISLAVGGALPYPAGQNAGAYGCMSGIQAQGMNVLGMASDQMGTQ